MKKHHIVITLLMVLMSTNGCVFIDSGPTSAPVLEPAQPPTLVPDVKLSVVSHEMTRVDGIPQVQAKIKNVGTSTIGLVEATINFFDGDGNLIDSVIDTVTNLEPHQTWDLAVECSGDDCKRVIKDEIKLKGTTTERR